MNQASASHSSRWLGAHGPQLMRVGLALGAIGLIASVVLGAFAGWERFFRAYLTAFMFVLSLALGGLFFTALQHATRAGWSVVVRRLAEGMMSNLLWIWVLFLPILLVALFGQGEFLYPWMGPALAEDPIIRGKAPFLTVWFWAARSVLYFVIWFALARFYYRRSVAQDASGEVAHTHRMQWLAPLTLILYAFTQTFAAIDWVMTLEAHWFSTMFGVYYFAASACGSFAMLILIMYLVQRMGKVQREITLEHYQDAGKLLFAFGIVFWAYIAYSQYMLIWYANLPEETAWYIPRMIGGWQWLSTLLLVGHFAAPFVFLISKHPKRMKTVLAAAAGWMLLMHYADVYWLTMPDLPLSALESATSFAELAASVEGAGATFSPHLLDLTCLVGLAGLFAAGTAWRLSGCALIPERDPRLRESLAFENI